MGSLVGWAQLDHSPSSQGFAAPGLSTGEHDFCIAKSNDLFLAFIWPGASSNILYCNVHSCCPATCSSFGFQDTVFPSHHFITPSHSSFLVPTTFSYLLMLVCPTALGPLLSTISIYYSQLHPVLWLKIPSMFWHVSKAYTPTEHPTARQSPLSNLGQWWKRWHGASVFHVIVQRYRLIEVPPSVNEEVRRSCTTSYASFQKWDASQEHSNVLTYLPARGLGISMGKHVIYCYIRL